MNKSEIFKKAHRVAKAVIKHGDDYRITFGAAVKWVLDQIKKEAKAQANKAPKTYNVTGDTFALKDKIKKAGGRWNSATKSWVVTLSKSDSLFRYEGRLAFTEVCAKSEKMSRRAAYNDFMNEGGEGFYHAI